MATRSFQRRRRARPLGARTFAPGAAEPRNDGKAERDKAERIEASKGRADSALSTVLEMFDSETFPEKVAQTVIQRVEGYDSPTLGWSLGNQLLALFSGTADARGFRQWHEVGRSVNKGAKAIYILGPIKRTITDKDATGGEDSKRTIVTGFKAIPVFRYEDTHGASVEPPEYRPAEFPPLHEVADALGITVRYAAHVDRFRGYYAPSRDEIVLCSHDVDVFFHELAHAAHRKVLRARGADLKGGQIPSQEIVAETVAAVLCQLYGFSGLVYHGAEYLRSYANGGDPAKAALKVLGDVQAVLYLIVEDAGASESPASTLEPVAVAA